MSRKKEKKPYYRKVEAILYNYPLWLVKLDTLLAELDGDGLKAVSYEGDKICLTQNWDGTAELAIKRLESRKAEQVKDLKTNIAMVERAKRILSDNQIQLLEKQYFTRNRLPVEFIWQELGLGKDAYYSLRDTTIGTLADIWNFI